MNDSKIFKKFTFQELITLFIVSLLAANFSFLLFNSSTIGLFISELLIIIFFIYKFKKADYNLSFNFLKSYGEIKEIIFIAVSIFFLTWGIEVIYVYTGITYFIFLNDLNFYGPLSFIVPYFGSFPDFPVGILDFNLPGIIYDILYFLEVLILLPLSEELFFRGALFTKISEKTGLKCGIILTALLYAIFSGKSFGNLLIFFTVGVGLSFVYAKSKNISKTIVTAFVFTLLYNLKVETKIYHLNTYVIFGSIIILLALISALYLIEYCKKNKSEIQKFG